MPDVTSWLVIAAGAGVILWVNWYFFRSRGPAVAAASAGGGPSEVTIVVRGGYEPSTVRARAGAPLRLVFDRRETSGCSEEVVIPDFNVRTFLPPFEKTAVDVTPPRPGTYEFTCGMSMLHGRIVAE